MAQINKKLAVQLQAEGLIPVKEAADRLGCHPASISRWIRVGQLQARKVNGTRFVRVEDLRALLRTEAPTTPPNCQVVRLPIEMPLPLCMRVES